MSRGRTNPQSLGYIVAACEEYERATRARGVEGLKINQALSEVSQITARLRMLCLELKDGEPCDPESDHICSGGD